MTFDLSNNEIKLVAALLDRAGEMFGNHGCNDFFLSLFVDMSANEKRALDKAIHDWNGDPEEHEPNREDYDHQADFVLMHFFADRLRGDDQAQETKS